MELATPGSAVRHASVARHVTDCATRPGDFYFFLKCFSPVTKLIILHTVVVLPYTHHIKMACLVTGGCGGGGGERCQNAQKQFILRAHWSQILYKPVP